MCHGDRCFWCCFSLKWRVLQKFGPRTPEHLFYYLPTGPSLPRFIAHLQISAFILGHVGFTYLVHAPPLAPPLWPRLQHGAKRCLVGPSAGVEERKQEPSSAPSLLKVWETPTCSDVCSVDAASASPLRDAARGELTCLRRGEDAILLRWPRSGSRRRHKSHHAAELRTKRRRRWMEGILRESERSFHPSTPLR